MANIGEFAKSLFRWANYVDGIKPRPQLLGNDEQSHKQQHSTLQQFCTTKKRFHIFYMLYPGIEGRILFVALCIYRLFLG